MKLPEVEVVIVVAVPDLMELEEGSGALLSRDRMVVKEPAHQEVYKLRLKDMMAVEALMDWVSDNRVDL